VLSGADPKRPVPVHIWRSVFADPIDIGQCVRVQWRDRAFLISGRRHGRSRSVGTWDEPSIVRLVLALALCVVVGFYLRFAAIHDQVDFGVYRAGGHAVVAGHDLYTLRVPPVGLPFTYPPVSAVLFAPLALIPVHVGQVVWMALSLVGLGVFVRLALRRYAIGWAAKNTSVWLVVFLLVARSDPVRVNLNFGQINVLIALLVVADLSGALPRVPRGVMTGVAAALKLTPLFLVAYYVAVRRYRTAVVAATTFVAVTGVAFLPAPGASIDYWFHGYFADARRTGGIAYVSNQSINGVIVRLSGSPDRARVFWLLVASVTATALLWAVRRLHTDWPWLAESIALAAMLLLSPVSWVHHWILALPFLIACFRLCTRENRSRLLVGLTAALTAALWFGIIWHVPNTHDREYHYNAWQFVVGNSDVLLLMATMAAALRATRATGPDRGERTANTSISN
jgi:alpha-1,2-mannosyltransferase